ncbi:MAG: hypothetical protein AAF798_19820 [Bacteroidota bacterium]
MKLIVPITLMLCLLFSCNSARKQAQAIQIEFGQKPTIVYQTTKDFSQYVPVILSEDKTRIVAYPRPKDVYYKGKLAKPTALASDYWLDNRGINKNVAFLDITYEEFSALPTKLPLDSLMAHIQEKNPLTACYDCGSIIELEKLNILIKGKALEKCKNLMK